MGKIDFSLPLLCFHSDTLWTLAGLVDIPPWWPLLCLENERNSRLIGDEGKQDGVSLL